jgi:PmbA protein
MTESESISLLEGIERELVRELPGAKLLSGHLEEGTSETEIFSSSGICAGFRSRAASLHLQAVGPESGSSATMILLAEREVRRFQPLTAAKRLANRLLLQRQGSAPNRERGDLLLGPAVAVRLLAGLIPLLVGSKAAHLAKSYRDRQGHIGSQLLTVIDDGRLPGGVLEAPVDGEGLPTREVVLIEQGNYLCPIVGWERTKADASDAKSPGLTGNRRRHSWRDLPVLGPSHLYLKPQKDVSVASLLGSIARGQYLIEPVGSGLFDFQTDRFRLPVCGFEIRQGMATSPMSQAWIEGSIGSLLRGIQAVARDLSFEPIGGMIGSPTILVTGLGIRRSGDG